MKLLPDPKHPNEDLWDAARVVPAGVGESFTLRNLQADRPLILILRSAATVKTEFDVEVPGAPTRHVTLEPSDGWLETRVVLPAPHASTAALHFGPSSSERASFQIWAVAAP
jgi:hypothetical protein